MPKQPTISPEAIEFNAILAAGMARVSRELRAEADAARAATGLKVGDEVRIKGGGHGGEEGVITGVSRSGHWELALHAGFSYTMFNNLGLERVTRAAATLAELKA